MSTTFKPPINQIHYYREMTANNMNVPIASKRPSVDDTLMTRAQTPEPRTSVGYWIKHLRLTIPSRLRDHATATCVMVMFLRLAISSTLDVGRGVRSMIPRQIYELPGDNCIMPRWTVLGSSVTRVSKSYGVHKTHIPDIDRQGELLAERVDHSTTSKGGPRYRRDTKTLRWISDTARTILHTTQTFKVGNNSFSSSR